MGLEGQHHPAVGQGFGHGQKRVQLVGMVGVIVVDIRAVENALALKPPPRAGEPGKAALHGGAGQTQNICR